jgi:hypothetical protein
VRSCAALNAIGPALFPTHRQKTKGDGNEPGRKAI